MYKRQHRKSFESGLWGFRIDEMREGRSDTIGRWCDEDPFRESTQVRSSSQRHHLSRGVCTDMSHHKLEHSVCVSGGRNIYVSQIMFHYMCECKSVSLEQLTTRR